MDTPEKISVVGTSGHGLAAFEAAKRQGLHIVGFLDSFKEAGTEVEGLKILGHPDKVAQLMKEFGFTAVFLGVSNNYIRREIWENLKSNAPDLKLASVIHPSAVVASNAQIGPGSLLMAGAIVNPGCKVGENCIVNTNASLDHNSEMKPHSSILPGVTTGGDVVIGECSCVCIGSIVSHRVHIGNHVVIGAGSLVLQDIPGHSLAYGTPARVIRKRQSDERHF